MSAVTTCLVAMQKATPEDLPGDTDLPDAAVLRLLPCGAPSAPRWLTSSRAGPALFVRPCYPVLFLLTTAFLASPQGPQDVVVSGSHGVGKRSFLSYVFFRLRQLPSPPTIVLDVPGSFVCMTADGAIRLGARGTTFQSELAERTTVYLCDAASNACTSPLPCRAKTLVVVSPIHDRQDDNLTQDTSRVTFVMPAWSTAELTACRAVCYPHVSCEELRQRQTTWGGLVRWSLAEPWAVATAQFARSVAQLTLDKAAALVEKLGSTDMGHGDTSEAHFLIQIDVESNSTFLPNEASLCSARACAALVGAAPSSDHVVSFLKTHRASFALRGLIRQVEEQLVRHLLVV